jgi:4-hydroxythreonine-4-phosphate dehydrogenase
MPKRKALPRVGISLGCPCGIGPEVTRKALKNRRLRNTLHPVTFGDAADAIEGVEHVVVSQLTASDRKPGQPTQKTGRAQYAYITMLAAHAKAGQVDAMCTAPVSKEVIIKAGVPFKGHTELLAEIFGCQVMMLMSGPRLSVALATNHVPLAKVSQAITKASLGAQLQLLDASLSKILKRRPRIAVCGLNPHAGEGGAMGREEIQIIEPAIASAKKKGLLVSGPFAADGLFAHATQAFAFDVALAMFHDQGLVATKTLDFERTVNVTLGLPVVRTSPDHGTAYDIAGKDCANEMPMVQALLKAVSLNAHFRL